MHLYKMTEWQDGNNRWVVNDVEEVAEAPGYWWYPARLLDITPAEYIELLYTKYHATHIAFTRNQNVLMFSFDKLADARKFKNDINRIARAKQFYIGAK